MKEKTTPKMIGELLVQEGFISERQLHEAINRQNSDLQNNMYAPLGEICVKMRFISRIDLNYVLKKYKHQIQLGEMLVNMGLLSYDELERGLELQKVENKRLGRIFVELGLITEENLVSSLSAQLGIPRISPSTGIADPGILRGINKAFLQKNECLPVFRDKDCVTVIMSDPLSNDKIRLIEGIYKCRVEPAIATSDEIQKGIDLLYNESRTTKPVPEAVSAGNKPNVTDSGMPEGYEENIVKIVDYILTNAVKEGATDIHIEPIDNMLRVRYRVDGVLCHKTDFPMNLANSIINRIKAVSGLDITDKRKHQDGRLGATVMNKLYDFRISTYASISGEALSIRILSNQSRFLDLDMIGFSPHNLALLKEIISQPSGIVMVTGPSGSGKTTTLYAIMTYLNDMAKKIVTVEDPVEYTVSGLVQGQISEKTGLSYNTFIKSVLRQDPDVIMIGEIRDKDSAQAVVDTCLTGHKVLTTFHTDETASALLRMSDIGIETFLISSTVMSVVAQRLVRTLCTHCKRKYKPGPDILSAFASIEKIDNKFTFYTAAGCPECNNTGFKGRAAVSEILVLDKNIRDAVLKRESASNIRAIARKSSGLISMIEDGFYKAAKGITSLEEILRVVTRSGIDTELKYSAEDIIAICDMQRKR